MAEPAFGDVRPAASAGPAPAPVAISGVETRKPPRVERLDAWLKLVCRMIPDVDEAFAGFGAEPGQDFAEIVAWPSGAPASPALRTAALRALARREGVACDADGNRDILSRRLRLGPGGRGAVAIAVPRLSDTARAALTQLLDWSAVWLDFIDGDSANRTAADCCLRVLRTGLDAVDRRRAATAMAAVVATALAAERVSVGITSGEHVELLALSHSASFNPRLKINRDIVQAMEEAIDERGTVFFPAMPEQPSRATRAHERLCSRDVATSACSLILANDGGTVGVMTIERGGRGGFANAERELLEELADAVGRVVAVRTALEQPLPARLRDACLGAGTRLGVTGSLPKRVLAAGAVLALAILCFGTGQRHVPAPAVLEGRVQRSLVAPIDGYIAEAPARAGDAVRAGDVVATIDTRTLDIERRRWQAEQAEYRKAHRRAIAELDRAEATIMEARLGRASSQLALIEEQLQRATVVAPFDGLIISGDLSRSMGAPVSRGDVLFEIAPLDDYRVDLEVDERDIARVSPGQTGSLALTAHAGERLAFTVDQITNVAETSDGRNVFRVEGRLDEHAGTLRPGMRGIGKIHAGEDRLIRVWSDRFTDRLKLWLWARAP